MTNDFFSRPAETKTEIPNTDRKKKVSSRIRDEKIETFEEILFRTRNLSSSNVESL